MNIIENKKKIAIIGKGTAGSFTAADFTRNTPHEISWHFDPDIPTQSVGEGSTLYLPNSLTFNLDFKIEDLGKIEGHIKRGVKKLDWNGTGDYISSFPLDAAGLHFNAVKLQDYTFNYLKDKIQIIPQNTNPSNIDADYIIDCSGKPIVYNEFYEAEYIPLNACHVTTCNWEYPKFDYTLCVARPYGWVFGIPLQSRCSIGYLYNSNINTLEEVKEDVKNIFQRFNLTPSDESKNLNFKNYFRKQNFTERIAYNGNASFFLEPMEASSTSMMYWINQKSKQIIGDPTQINSINNLYLKENIDIQRMIILHYLAGSQFKTKFWDFAYTKAKKCFTDSYFIEDFKQQYDYTNFCISNKTYNISHPELPALGGWVVNNYIQNILGLNLNNKLNKLLNI